MSGFLETPRGDKQEYTDLVAFLSIEQKKVKQLTKERDKLLDDKINILEQLIASTEKHGALAEQNLEITEQNLRLIDENIELEHKNMEVEVKNMELKDTNMALMLDILTLDGQELENRGNQLLEAFEGDAVQIPREVEGARFPQGEALHVPGAYPADEAAPIPDFIPAVPLQAIFTGNIEGNYAPNLVGGHRPNFQGSFSCTINGHNTHSVSQGQLTDVMTAETRAFTRAMEEFIGKIEAQVMLQADLEAQARYLAQQRLGE
jgi:hypothetical protein